MHYQITSAFRMYFEQTQRLINFNLKRFRTLPLREFGTPVHLLLNSGTVRYIQSVYGCRVTSFKGQIAPYKDSVARLRCCLQGPTDQIFNQLDPLLQNIQNEVKGFYRELKVSNLPTIDAESLLCLLMYILVQADVLNCYSKLKQVQSSRRFQLKSSAGHMLVNLIGCCELLARNEVRHQRDETSGQFISVLQGILKKQTQLKSIK